MNFFGDFFKNKTANFNKDGLNSTNNFLFLQDRQEIARLTREQQDHLKAARNIEKKIHLIEESTKTLMPQLSSFHNALRQKVKWYALWHTKPYARLTHWFSLFLIVAFGGSFFFSFIDSVKAENKVWNGMFLGNWSDPNNWLPVGVPQAGDSVTFDSTSDAVVVIDDIGDWGGSGESLSIIGDDGLDDGYDGQIMQNVAIPDMGSFLMSGSSSSAVFTQGDMQNLAVSSFSISGGTFDGSNVKVNNTISTDLNISGGTFNDPQNLAIGGDFILSGGNYVVDSSVEMTIGGNFDNTANGFVGEPSVTFIDDTKTTLITGDTTFNSFTSNAPGKEIIFTSGSVQTTNIFLLSGAPGNLISLRSSVDSEEWFINPGVVSVSYVDVKDSNNIGTSISSYLSKNSGNNTNWFFTINLSGEIRAGDSFFGGICTVGIAINGEAYSTQLVEACEEGAVFNFSGVTVNDGDVVLLYQQGDEDPIFPSDLSNTIVVVNTLEDVQVNLIEDTIAVYSYLGDSVTNSDLLSAYSSIDSSYLIYSVADGDLTADNGEETGPHFFVGENTIFTPGGDISGIVNLTIGSDATLDATSSSITLSGNWANNGDFVSADSLVLFQSSAFQNLDNGSRTFNDLYIDSRGVTLQNNPIDVDGDFHLMGGIFNSNSLGQNFAGNVTLDGGTYVKGGTFIFDGGSSSVYTDNINANIGLVNVAGEEGKEVTLGSSMTVDILIIDANNTLDLTSNGYILDLALHLETGTLVEQEVQPVLFVDGVLDVGTNSTVRYSAFKSLADVFITTIPYNNIEFTGDETYVLTGNLTGLNALTGNLTIGADAILDAVVGQNYGIALAGNWSSLGDFIPRAGTVTFNGSSGVQLLDHGTSFAEFHNLDINNTGDGVQLINNNIGVANNFRLLSGTFDANGQNQRFQKDITFNDGTTYIKGGVFSFYGITMNYSDNNSVKQNIGTVEIDKSSPAGAVVLQTDMLVDTMNIKDATVLNLGNNTLELNASGSAGELDVLFVDGTLNPGTGTVRYSALNDSGHVRVAATTYHNLEFTGLDETYFPANDLTTSNAMTGSITIAEGSIFYSDSTDVELAGNVLNNGSFLSIEGNITLSGNFINNNIAKFLLNNLTFNRASGTQDFDTGGLDPDFVYFSNIVHSGAGTLRLINNPLRIGNDNAIDASGSLTNNSGIFNANSQDIYIEGDWINGASVINLANVYLDLCYEVECNDPERTIQVIEAGSSFFNNLNKRSGSGFTVQLGENIGVNGGFESQGGVFDTNGFNQNFAGNFTLENGATYTKGGTITFDGSGSAIYEDKNDSKQNIGKVNINGSSGKSLTLASGMNVNTLSIASDNTLSLGSDGHTLKFEGDGSDSGVNIGICGIAVFINEGVLSAGSNSVVEYAVNTDDEETICVAPAAYNSVLFSADGETFKLEGNLTGANQLSGNLTINDGVTLDVVEDENFDIALQGNWSQAGNNADFKEREGTVTFNGSGTQTINFILLPHTFYNLDIDKPEGSILQTAALPLVTLNNFRLLSGTFDGSDGVQVFAGDVTFESGTTYIHGEEVMSEEVECSTCFVGSFGDGDINFTDNTIEKQNIGVAKLFENIDLTIQTGMKVDTLEIDDGSSISLGSNTLELANVGSLADVFSVSGDNPFSSGTGTVKYSATNSGGNINVATLPYHSLQFSGSETYDLNGDLINDNALTGSVLIDSGATLDAVSGQNYAISISGNWVNNGSFEPQSNTVSFVSSSGIQDLNSGGTGAGKSFNNITHSGAGTLRLISNHLGLGGSINNSAGTFDANGQDITIGGNWANSAIFIAGSGTVNFNSGLSRTLSSGGTGANNRFNNLTHSGAGTLQVINNNLEATGNFVNSSGFFDFNDFSLTLVGNFTNAGSFDFGAGQIVLNKASGTQVLDSGIGGGSESGKTFNNIVHSGAGTLQLQNVLYALGDFFQSAGTFDANGQNQYFGGNVLISNNASYIKGGVLRFVGDEASIFADSNSTKQNMGTVILAGSSGKQVTLNSSATVDTLNIGANNTLSLNSLGNILTLVNNGASSDVLTVVGALNPGTNSTVRYSATNSGGNVNVAPTTYNNVQFSGAEIYDLQGDLTDGNVLTGSLTIDSGSQFQSLGNDIALQGSWNNSGNFVHNDNTVTFEDASKVSNVTGETTFHTFVVETAGKTLAFEAGSTQEVQGESTWIVLGQEGNNVVLEMLGGTSGVDQWFINPTTWNVNYVTVSDSNNLASSEIDPANYIDQGNNTNWFVTPTPPDPPAPPDGDGGPGPGGGGGGGGGTLPPSSPPDLWCENEDQYINYQDWSEARCNPPFNLLWCQAEQAYIQAVAWSQQRCNPPQDTIWCQAEGQYIPSVDWTSQRCSGPTLLWCQLEQAYILPGDWSELRCQASDNLTWCQTEGQYIPQEEWNRNRCAGEEMLVWCEYEQRHLWPQDWSAQRCSPPIGQTYCALEDGFIPSIEWSQQRCQPIVEDTTWCQNEQQRIPSGEWSAQRCRIVSLVSIFEDARDFWERPEVQETTNAIAITGLALSSIAMFSRFLFFPLSFFDWWSLLIRIISALLVTFGLKKQKRPWGTVYDSVTKQPLDPAYVSLETLDGKEINSSFTDLDGRYGFLTETGKYRMVANKTNYIFPSAKLIGKTNDEIYNNLYFGQEFATQKQGEVVIRDIPMDQEKFDWNEFAKKQQGLLKFHSRFDLLFRQISQVFFAFGFMVAIVSVALTPDKLNFIILGLYILLAILMMFGVKPRTYGSLFDKVTGAPMSFAIVSVYAADLQKEMFKRVADKLGRYYILVPRGMYYLQIEKKNEDGSYTHIFTSSVIDAKSGIIHDIFRI